MPFSGSGHQLPEHPGRHVAVDGVVQLRPEEAMVEAMLGGWRAQQTARVAGQVEEWTLSLTAERHLAAATIRGDQTGISPVERIPH